MCSSDLNRRVDEENRMQFDEEGNPIEAPVDSMQMVMNSLSSNPKSREYYLQQIPFSEEDLKTSNIIIADKLFKAARPPSRCFMESSMFFLVRYV